MKWLQSQWEQSSIISGTLAIGIWASIIFLAVTQAPVPEILYFGGSTVIGFFFGAKVGQQQGERSALIRRLDKEG